LIMKNIYLVQVGEIFNAKNKTAYLPYAVGAIAAKSMSNELIRNIYSLKRIVFLREPVEQLAGSLQNPYLVGFSCYLWSYEYCKAAAKEIKKIFPKCIVVFGGHSVPSDTSLLEECEYIDFLVHGQGEEVAEMLLCALEENNSLSDVPNISYRSDDLTLVQTVRKTITGCRYPSPYTEGLFDDIIIKNPDMHFSAILETNRGCPNKCAFCDWGPRNQEVCMFPMERVKGDIDWFSEHKIEYVWEVDANFGQFERDSQITDWLIEAKKKTGYPNRIYINYSKFNNQNVFELAKRFSEVDLSKSTTISLQTLSDEVLKNIGRSNMTMEHFSGLMTLYMNAKIPVYSELILGLPGETYESFTEGVGKLLESGQHSGIEVYDCVLLNNSVLANKNYIKKHEIKAVHVPFFTQHSEFTDNDVTEFSDIVVSTKSLPSEDWVRCKLFAIAVQSLHCLGLLRNFAVYIYNEKHIAYRDFYIKLVEWYLSHPSTLGYEVFDSVQEILIRVTKGINVQYYYNESSGNVRWFLDEGAFLCFVSDLDRFYDETSEFLKIFDIDEDIFKQLLRFQKNIICVQDNNTPVFSQDYDFYSYFKQSIYLNNYKPLEKLRNTITILNGTAYESFEEYARVILWYGRRLVKSVRIFNPNNVNVVYI